MSYSLHIKKNSTVYDVSDYITDISDFQYYSRNTNYSLISDDMDFKLSKNYLSIYPSIFFENKDSVYIYSSSVLLFNGVIKKVEYDSEKLQYSFEADCKLVELKEYLVSTADMSASFNNFKTGFEIYFGLSPAHFISFDNVYSASFSRAGLNLDFTYRGANEIYANVQYLSSSYISPTASLIFEQSSKNIILGDLYCYIPQLYCVNQKYVYTTSELNSSPEAIKDRITLYELIDSLNKISGYIFIPKDSGSYYVVNNRYNPNRNVNTETFYNEYYESKFKYGISANYVIPYKSNITNENERYSWYAFMPSPLTGEKKWYIQAGNANDNNVKDYITSYYNLIDEDDPDVEWLNHLIFFNFVATGSTNAVNIVMPSFANSTDGLLSRPLFASMGNGYYQEYENYINVEKVAALENYIEIKNINDGKSISKIKTATFTYIPQDFYGAG